MLKHIFKALGLSGQQPEARTTGADEKRRDSEPVNHQNPTGFHRQAIQAAIDRSPYIKPEARARVFAHLVHEKRLFQSDDLLTLQEKKNLGLNSRQKIHRDLTEVLSDEGLHCGYPSSVISDLGLAAFFHSKNRDELLRLRDSKVATGVKRTSCDVTGEKPCAWARANKGKVLPLSEETENDRWRNCDCEPYCKGMYEAVLIEF